MDLLGSTQLKISLDGLWGKRDVAMVQGCIILGWLESHVIAPFGWHMSLRMAAVRSRRQSQQHGQL